MTTRARKRKLEREIRDQRTAPLAKPLPLGKLSAEPPKKVSQTDWLFNRQQVKRGTPKPWFKVPESELKTHAQKRAERAVARWKAVA